MHTVCFLNSESNPGNYPVSLLTMKNGLIFTDTKGETQTKMEAEFFTNPEEFRGWLENYHDKTRELWLGFYKKAKGQFIGFTYPDAVQIALCYGWIDGKTQSIDPYTYKIRFTPRKHDSYWSLINMNRVKALTEAGLMQASGLAAYERRKPEKSGTYSYERELSAFLPEMESALKENRRAWSFFTGQSPSYKKTSIYWIMSAKQEVTREKRFRILLDCSESGLKIPLLRTISGHRKPLN